MAREHRTGFFSRLFSPIISFFRAIGRFFRFLFSSSRGSEVRRPLVTAAVTPTTARKPATAPVVVTPAAAPAAAPAVVHVETHAAPVIAVAPPGPVSTRSPSSSSLGPVSLPGTPTERAPRSIHDIFATHFTNAETTDNGDCLFAAVAHSIPGQDAARLRALACDHLGNNYEHMGSVTPLIEHVREAIERGTVPPGCRFDREAVTLNVYGAGSGRGGLFINDDIVYYTAYIAKMRESRVYATGVEITALARSLNRPIVLFTGGRADLFEKAEGGTTDLTGEPIFIHYNGTNHYSGLTLGGGGSPRALFDEIRQALARPAARPTP